MHCNANIPEIYGWLRKEYLYDLRSHHGEFAACCIFGIASITGRALGFHALLEDGAMIWRLPLNAFVCRDHPGEAPVWPLEMHQLWDCSSYEVAVTEFDRLQELDVDVILKDRETSSGTYLFTLDWFGSTESEAAGDGGHKCAHVILLDNGLIVAQPNNRLRWHDAAFVKPFRRRPDYKTMTRTWKVENGRKWVTDDSDRMFYEVEGREENDGRSIG